MTIHPEESGHSELLYRMPCQMKNKDEIVDANRIRERIRALRARVTTYVSIAKEIGVPPGTLSAFVTSRTNRMALPKMLKLLEYLDGMKGENPFNPSAPPKNHFVETVVSIENETDRTQNSVALNHESLPEASTRLRNYLLQRFHNNGDCDGIREKIEIDELDTALLIRLYGIMDERE